MPSGSGGILNKGLKFVELIELLNTFTKVFLLGNTSYKEGPDNSSDNLVLMLMHRSWCIEVVTVCKNPRNEVAAF